MWIVSDANGWVEQVFSGRQAPLKFFRISGYTAGIHISSLEGRQTPLERCGPPPLTPPQVTRLRFKAGSETSAPQLLTFIAGGLLERSEILRCVAEQAATTPEDGA
jgi:hypothetical protein